MLPLISVIVPIYNSERYLDKCISSILNQTYKNLEIILVNDGSTDRSVTICEKYAMIDDRIKVVTKKNGGQSSARNAGLDICNGDYVGFVDSDDWISKGMYQTLYSKFDNKKMIVSIGLQEINQNEEIVRERIYNEDIISNDMGLKRILLGNEEVSVCNKLFRRKDIENTRFSENKLNEDVLFLIDVVNHVEKISYSSDIGYFYFQRTGSTSRVFGKAVHDMVYNAKYVRARVERNYPELSKEAERFEIFQHMSFLLCCPSNYNRKEDPLCAEVLSYVRKNILKGLKNPYLTKKDKIKLIGVSVCPRVMSKIVEIRAKK